MVKPFSLLLMFLACLATACGAALPIEPPTRTPLIVPTPTVNKVARLEIEMNGVRLSIETPAGWEGRTTGDGLMLAEHFDPMDDAAGDDVQMHLFVHPTNQFRAPQDTTVNPAWDMLKQVQANPNYMGTAKTTEPQPFNWDGHDSAYYLVNDGSGSVSILLAMLVRDPMVLVVSNISAPLSRHQDIRPLLPTLFQTLTINGQPLSLTVLDSLPDPLVFPQ
jgi:hypothetical protein